MLRASRTLRMRKGRQMSSKKIKILLYQTQPKPCVTLECGHRLRVTTRNSARLRKRQREGQALGTRGCPLCAFGGGGSTVHERAAYWLGDALELANFHGARADEIRAQAIEAFRAVTGTEPALRIEREDRTRVEYGIRCADCDEELGRLAVETKNGKLAEPGCWGDDPEPEAIRRALEGQEPKRHPLLRSAEISRHFGEDGGIFAEQERPGLWRLYSRPSGATVYRCRNTPKGGLRAVRVVTYGAVTRWIVTKENESAPRELVTRDDANRPLCRCGHPEAEHGLGNYAGACDGAVYENGRPSVCRCLNYEPSQPPHGCEEGPVFCCARAD